MTKRRGRFGRASGIAEDCPCKQDKVEFIVMSTLSDEAAQIVESLPKDKAQALLEYARYLAEAVDREQWERRFGDSRYVPKLRQMADEALNEFRSGHTEPLNPDEM